ncbi:MAG: hypothetical protein LQ344_005534 [Seirophora lacunosa]|nr:MAG: hypothetical protein LQ344_005534 [Seirophora lacunosa]
MGCCHSTANADSATSPYLPVHHPAATASASSSRAAIAPPLPLPSPRNSSPTLTQAPSRSHRTLAPSEHFNAPLRPHIPLSKPKSRSGNSNSKASSAKRTWTRSLLEKERSEFFDTRVTGRGEVWGGLKLATELLREGDVQDAQGVLDASGVTVPTGDLVDGCYDEQGALYQLPAWVVAEPERVVEDDSKLEGVEAGGEVRGVDEEEDEEGDVVGEKEKGKEVVSGGKEVKVKARLSDRGGPDVVVMVGREERIAAVVRKIQREANLPGKGRIKIAYMGKLLKEGESLQAQGWKEGHVINALVFPQ